MVVQPYFFRDRLTAIAYKHFSDFSNQNYAIDKIKTALIHLSSHALKDFS